jgi:tetratricopeptide (TPR) repeat protein
MHPDRDRELLGQVEALEEAGRYSSAVLVWDQLCHSNPGVPRFFARCGRAHYRQGKLSDALRDFDFALRLKPDAPATLFFRARTHEKLADLTKALADYEASAAISPEADAYLNIALIHRFQRRIAESEKALRRAIELDPGNETARGLLDSWRIDGC